MPGYALRSTQQRPISPISDADELNTTMMDDGTSSLQAQLMGVIEGLKDLTRAVVESRTDINCLKNQIDEIQARVSTTALVGSSLGRNEVPATEPVASSNNSADQFGNGVQRLGNPIAHVENPALPTISQGQLVCTDSMTKLYDLPQFSGNADEWPLFIANFKDTTEMFKYSHRQNLMRLQKCLFGAAKEAVSSMLIFPNDVPKVIEELEFRFGRPDILVRSQILKVKQFPNIFKRKMGQIVEFSTAVRNVVAFLNSAGCQQHLMSTTLLDEMVSKLPVDQQFEWAKEAAYNKTVSFCVRIF